MGKLLVLLQDFLYRYAKIPSHRVNKFTISGFLFLFWLLFFDTHSIIESIQLRMTLNKILSAKEQFKTDIIKSKEDLKDLETNKEKYAREKFYMHQENEEVFIIERKK